MIKKLINKLKNKEKHSKDFDEYMSPNMSPDELLKSLKEWEENPGSHPALEKWYEDNYKNKK